MKDRKKKLWLVACFGLLAMGCVDSDPIGGNGDQPLVVEAGIRDHSDLPVTRVAVDNDYDRSDFVTGDVIRIVRTKNGNTSSLDYTFSGTAWQPVVVSNYFKFESSATYQASFPSNYTSIRSDQTNEENYRLSNLLRTSEVAVSRLGVIGFTGAGAFTHQNVKLTLNFVGNNTLSFSSVIVQASGLYSGGASTETVYLLRPDATVYTWQGVVFPKGSATTINVSFTDNNSVTYKVDLSCAMAAGKNYVYTLTVRNNILVALGSEIKPWQDELQYVGPFTK